MKTVAKVADRVVMLYPMARLGPREPQIIYDGPPEGMETHADPRVGQFVRGEAGERLRELAQLRNDGAAGPEVRPARCEEQRGPQRQERS
jgi:phospholipid/cholesterol/gamma-HCH transport system ATP-binding protein